MTDDARLPTGRKERGVDLVESIIRPNDFRCDTFENVLTKARGQIGQHIEYHIVRYGPETRDVVQRRGEQSIFENTLLRVNFAIPLDRYEFYAVRW